MITIEITTADITAVEIIIRRFFQYLQQQISWIRTFIKGLNDDSLWFFEIHYMLSSDLISNYSNFSALTLNVSC